MVATQREQIAILKAFGYTNTAVWAHYTKLILVVVAIGVAMGIGAGAWMGKGMSNVYMAFYRFPFIDYMLRPKVAVLAALITSAAALAGTVLAVRRAAVLPPATAMRPEPPTAYRETFLERAGIKRFLSQPSRMIARHIERRPVKSLLTVVGIALACGIMMVGRFQEDSIDFMIDVQYSMSQRQDLTVTFVEPTSRRALFELASLRGVVHAEDFRSVPVRLKFEHREHRTSILGVDPASELHRVLDMDLEPVEVGAEGVVLTDYLGRLLGVEPGDMLTVEVLEGSRPVRRVPVVGLSKQYMGLQAYMEKGALNRFMREGYAINGAYLTVDHRYRDEVFAEIKDMPRVAGTVIKRSAIDAFYETISETILFFTFISTLLGATIAFGVVYNNAIIALSERSRELSSLRVLGFTRAEISYILLGEMAVLTLAAVPLGFVFGRLFCSYLATRLQSELYRVPLVLEVDTYAFAATVVIVSAVVSALIVKRKLDRLDLIGVLKTKE
jgi:putative ABC transport system permease protein